MFGTEIAEVRPYGRNLELDCLYDLTHDKGIQLYEAEAFQKKPDKFSKRTEKTLHGVQSPFFGSDDNFAPVNS